MNYKKLFSNLLEDNKCKLLVIVFFISLALMVIGIIAQTFYINNCLVSEGDLLTDWNCSVAIKSILGLFLFVPNLAKSMSLIIFLHPQKWVETILTFIINFIGIMMVDSSLKVIKSILKIQK